MATSEQRKEVLKTVDERIKELSDVDPKKLDRTSDLSPKINFKEAVPHFEEMLDLSKQLGQRDLSRLTHTQLTAIGSALGRLIALIKKVKEFDIDQNAPGEVCKEIITEVNSAYDGIMEPLILPLAFTATQATDYAKIEREAKGYHATMKKESEELLEFISNARDQAERALSAVKEQAAEAGVSTNAQIFVGDAQRHENAAKTWLRATIVMASITFLAAGSALYTAFVYHPIGIPETIQYVVAKLLVLSTLSFVVFWCARNYKSQKHNETLNKYRANALMTFRAFVEGTSDIRVKDAILLQAAQAAFSGRPTGFDAAENESPTVNPVVEILGKTLSPSSEGA